MVVLMVVALVVVALVVVVLLQLVDEGTRRMEVVVGAHARHHRHSH